MVKKYIVERLSVSLFMVVSAAIVLLHPDEVCAKPEQRPYIISIVVNHPDTDVKIEIIPKPDFQESEMQRYKGFPEYSLNPNFVSVDKSFYGWVDVCHDEFDYSISYDIDINADGSYEHKKIKGDYTLHFERPGTYKIAFRGDIPRLAISNDPYEKHYKQLPRVISYSDYAKQLKPKGLDYYIDEVIQWGDIEWKSMHSMFNGQPFVRIAAKDKPDLSRVSNMSYMFQNSHHFNDPIEHWDVSHVKCMRTMFNRAKEFNQPLEKWDMSAAVDISFMFAMTDKFNQPLEMWNTSRALLSHNFSEQRKLRIHNVFSHFGYEIIVENFV